MKEKIIYSDDLRNTIADVYSQVSYKAFESVFPITEVASATRPSIGQHYTVTGYCNQGKIDISICNPDAGMVTHTFDLGLIRLQILNDPRLYESPIGTDVSSSPSPTNSLQSRIENIEMFLLGKHDNEMFKAVIDELKRQAAMEQE